MGSKITLSSFQRLQPYGGLGFVLILATVSHFLFSHLGFNPTDDGFILSGSRRIFDGQIPHRDFISIRPAGSYLLHSVFFLFNRDSIIWFTRFFVWIEFASIAWIWTVIISKSTKVFTKYYLKVLAAIIVFVFSVHCYPNYVFHSTDALFFSSLGFILCYRDDKYGIIKMIGYLLIGITPLFRQNFVLLIPVSIILLNNWRKFHIWIVSFIPIAMYLLYLLSHNAFEDFLIQISTYSYKESLETGIIRYLAHKGTAIGVLSGFIIILMIKKRIRLRPFINYDNIISYSGIIILFIIPLIALFVLVMKGFAYVNYPSFAIFGMVFSIIVYYLYDYRKFTSFITIGIIIMFIAWSSSISIGYNSPALFMGPLVLYLITIPITHFRKAVNGSIYGEKNIDNAQNIINKHKYLLKTCFAFLLIASIISFVYVRKNHIYRDLPSLELKYDLGGTLIGAKNIRTNRNTYEVIKDLNIAKNKVKSEIKQYVIIPDFSVNWICSKQQNPISIDWAQDTELGKEELVLRITEELEGNRNNIIVIVQKFEANSLEYGFVPFFKSYSIVDYVKKHFNKVGETKYFELYE